MVECLVSGKVEKKKKQPDKPSRGVRHVVTHSVFLLLKHRIPSPHVATWGRGKWVDPSSLSPGRTPPCVFP